MERILMAMSGGLDSSIAARLLIEQNYEVIGCTFRTWDYINESCLSKNTGCCSIEAIHDAKKFCEDNKIEHIVVDFRNEFRKQVIEYFVNEYARGRTPNPCVVCNTSIKWGLMLDLAQQMNCRYIATGHYANIKKYGNRHVLAIGKDKDKDQTYFLWQLTSQQLERTIFPLSNLTKKEVREIAQRLGYQSLSKKRESQEICFVGKSYIEFIKEHYPEIYSSIGEGNVINTKGEIIGRHKGFLHYTIGQRKGLGIALGEPHYIVAINPHENLIVLGKYDDLKTNKFYVENVLINKYENLPDELEVEVKIRYNSKPVKATIKKVDDNRIEVICHNDVYAVTPGQSAVFYEQDEVIGGGIIC